MIRVLAASLLLVACASNNKGNVGTDSPVSSDSSGCAITLMFNPPMPEADAFATIRVVAHAPVGGVPTYHWHIVHNNADVAFTSMAADDSQIDFIAPDPGNYDVASSVTGTAFCQDALTHFYVAQQGAHVTDFRLRVTPPPSFAPPQDQIIRIHGGADLDRAIALDPGLPLTGTVKNGTTGVPAYMRFMPVASPTAIVETFTQANGSFSVQLLGQSHDVLVVPAVAGLAPKRFTWTPGMTMFGVDAGTPVSGVVRDPANAVIAGAKVQVVIAGVPSTLTTTAADGSFTVRVAQLGAMSEVDVTPPAGRGLARLHAVGAFDLAQSVQVRFTGATCDLANTTVRRAAANLPGAKVTVVGTLTSAGTVTTGTTNVTATGDVRIPATVDGAGRLPSVLVPRATLVAVVDVAAGDLAVAAIDTTACPALAINAPAIVTAIGTVQDTQLAALSGVELEATPIGSLALAGALPVQVRTATGGSFTIGLASGGRYDLRVSDPAGRGAPFVVLGMLAGNVPTSVTLPLALHVKGNVTVPNNPNAVAGASIQILCLVCSGLDAARPIAETSTDSQSHYLVAVPDPGTM